MDYLYCGNALNVLKTFPDESVDCVITSPPYWSLRDYGIKPVIWDEKEDCPHEFHLQKRKAISDEKIRWVHRQNGVDLKAGKITNPQAVLKSTASKDHTVRDGFCIHCSAWKGTLGQEPDFYLYVKHLCDVFDEIKRVLKKDGTCFVNLGDTYGGSLRGWGARKPSKTGFQKPAGLDPRYVKGAQATAKLMPKCLLQLPSRFALEMVHRGWILRNEIIWHKPNAMPSSAKDRFTVDFEKVFFFVKRKKYAFNPLFEKSIWAEKDPRSQIPGGRKSGGKSLTGIYAMQRVSFGNGNRRNKRCVWTVPTKPFSGAHFATFPEKLVEPLMEAGCPENGIALDPFMGAGTVAVVAKKMNRHFIGIEMNPDYINIARKRISDTCRTNSKA